MSRRAPACGPATVVRKRPTRKRRSGAAARLRRAMGRGGRVAGSDSKAKMCCAARYPFVPAEAGTQPLNLDSRLRGNERRSFVRLPRLGPARVCPQPARLECTLEMKKDVWID